MTAVESVVGVAFLLAFERKVVAFLHLMLVLLLLDLSVIVSLKKREEN
jgi:hypothetical protein